MKPPKNPLAGTRVGEVARKARRGLFVPKIRGERRQPGESRAAKVDQELDPKLAILGVPLYDANARQAELGSYMAPRDGW